MKLPNYCEAKNREKVEIKYKEYYMEGMLNETKGKVF